VTRRGSDRLPTGRSIMKLGAGAPTLTAFYADGDQVEYRSQTLGKWLFGTVRVTMKPATFEVRYDLTVALTKQRRVDVQLKELRKPLKQNEEVEVLTKRESVSVWAPARICGEQAALATNFGYKVEVLASGEIMEDVPAQRIRRRFAVGQQVKAYRGVTEGWSVGTVEAVSEYEESGDDTNRQMEVDDQEVRPSIRASGAMSDRSRRGSADRSPSPDFTVMSARGVSTKPWSMLRVKFPEDVVNQEGDNDWIPSYLVH